MKRGVVSAGVALAVLLFLVWRWREARVPYDPALRAALSGITNDYRQVIVLVEGADALDAATRARSIAAGRMIFFRKQNALEELSRTLTPNGIRQLIRYLDTDPGLHDADKLAFLDLSEELQAAAPQSAPLRVLHDDLQSVQLAYREEVTRIFSQFAKRGQSATREKWDAYVRYLKQLTSREKILGEMSDSLPEEPTESTRGANGKEIFGNEFAPKTVALTFDDGPHPRYTEQVLALLRKYGIKAAFFELGVNLGVVEGTQVKLGLNAKISREVLDAGHVIANHSYSHRVLSKLPKRSAPARSIAPTCCSRPSPDKSLSCFGPLWRAQQGDP
jgi:hypothetical protein